MIVKYSILYILLSLLLIIAILNFYAFQYFWYWRLWWFDLLMHFLGGFFVGLLVFWFYPPPPTNQKMSTRRLAFASLVWPALAAAVVVGVLWELFEFGVDKYWSAHLNLKTFQILQAGLVDSLSDLSFDLIGALSVGLLVWFFPVVIELTRATGKVLKSDLNEN